ncbi:MAG: 4-hydroxythreonine-4-phosphate dehydrogenase PdxA [Candidatus Caldarchaeum sp.]
MKRTVVGITMGDPCGVGPEVTIRALSDMELYSEIRPLVFGDAMVIEEAKRLTGVECDFEVVDHSNFPVDMITIGKPCAEAGRASLEYVQSAVDYVLSGRVDALVTAPISKEAIHLAGSRYPGHTEILRELSGANRVAMMFEGEKFRVVLVTIHVALSEVPSLITQESVFSTIEIAYTSLKKLCGVTSPRLAVAGLNPHAGEGGAFGREEIEFIRPAVMAAREKGIEVEGPLPPDTLFYHALQGKWDAVVAMYHDQGLIPFKMVSFEDGVNVTLGLPFVRTSPDHGTAFDIAWRGIANPSSMLSAIRVASRFARNLKAFAHLPATPV